MGGLKIKGGKRFSGWRRVLLLTGIVFAALLAFYAPGAVSHHHDTGEVRMARGPHCGQGQAHQGGECPLEGAEKAEDCKLEKACPLLRGEKEDGNCPVKRLIGNKVVCPVMENRTFTADENTIAVEHEGRVYLLCCPPCEDRFEADPERYTRHQGEGSQRGHHAH